MPGQHELARQFGVSLTTMRTAIGILDQEGLLRTEHGLGTFVSKAAQKRLAALVVDDDPEAVQLLQEVLEGQGATVHTAGSRAAALDAVAKTGFDIIFLDVVMPGGSGVDTFADLRRQQLQTPVVFVTGVADAEMIARAAEHGPLTLIRKPVEIGQVREVLSATSLARAGRGWGGA